MKLDLGCGNKTPEGFDGVDVAPLGQSWVLDLMKFPWPFATESCEELRSSHFVEHLPARDVEWRDVLLPKDERARQLVGRDFLFAFFDECHRILIPGGKMSVIVPAGRSNGAFQDPTHRRYLMEETFYYLDAEWREANELGHYRTETNFSVEIGGAMQPRKQFPDGLAHAPNRTDWNFYAEWRVTLVKR